MCWISVPSNKEAMDNKGAMGNNKEVGAGSNSSRAVGEDSNKQVGEDSNKAAGEANSSKQLGADKDNMMKMKKMNGETIYRGMSGLRTNNNRITISWMSMAKRNSLALKAWLRSRSSKWKPVLIRVWLSSWGKREKNLLIIDFRRITTPFLENGKTSLNGKT